ncbi:MAG: hypothetical protein U0168_28580 [Nannocystaceae bacterium]
MFELGPLLLQRYRAIFETLFHEDRALTLRRGVWGLLLDWSAPRRSAARTAGSPWSRPPVRSAWAR